MRDMVTEMKSLSSVAHLKELSIIFHSYFMDMIADGR